MRVAFRSLLTLAIAGFVVVSAVPTRASQGQAPAQSAQPLVYPPNDPARDIAGALSKARTDGKHVLLDFGADWCPDCRVLGALFETEVVRPFAEANFHVVHIDVGRRDKNADLVEKYSATSGEWIPAVVVLDPAGKTVARTDDVVRLTRRHTPEEVLALLKQWAPKKTWLALSSFTQHGIRVDLALEKDSSGQAWLAGTFSPTEADTHLYGKDLPATGLDGLGRPTRLSVSSVSGLAAAGALIANRPVEDDRIDLLKQTFPVYPAGPVTLRFPVTVPARGATTRAELSVTYMGCGPKGCMPPVVDRRIAVVVPGDLR
jgi:thiol-disulfide isomerase/thioredoxin